MSEVATPTPVVDQPIEQKVAETKEAPKTGFQEKTQEELEKMSGSELAAYFAAKKAVEVGQPKKQATNVVKDAAEAAKEAIRKYKVKVEGQEIEVDEDELKRGYGHLKSANNRFREGMVARKQAEDFIAMMKNPETFYETAKKLGHDPRKLAEEYLVRQLEDELMDPRDRELRDTKSKLKQIEEMERKQKEALDQQRNDALKQKYAKDYSDQFVSALQEIQLPATKPMVAEMAKYVSRAAKLGFEMTPLEAATLVREDVESAHRRLIGDADGETLIKLLGDDLANKVRRYDTQRLKNPEQNLKTPTEQPEPRAKQKPHGRRMTSKEWREYNRK